MCIYHCIEKGEEQYTFIDTFSCETGEIEYKKPGQGDAAQIFFCEGFSPLYMFTMQIPLLR